MSETSLLSARTWTQAAEVLLLPLASGNLTWRLGYSELFSLGGPLEYAANHRSTRTLVPACINLCVCMCMCVYIVSIYADYLDTSVHVCVDNYVQATN